MARSRIRSWGASVGDDGRTRFRIWAPAHETISLRLLDRAGDLPMVRQSDGWHELITDRAGHGTLYRYVLPGVEVPDPASMFQPHDVSGPSEVIDLARYRWQHPGWTGRRWSEAIIYELHIGAFTAEGTFRAAMEKLPHLVALGITAIELMPVADFSGACNWGYDGVMLYAPDSTYGRPEDLQALVDAAHGAGLMVFLDVVYNHFGPDGNYLSAYAPQFFTARYPTPWGAGINFDGDSAQHVRQFFIDNALYWLQDYRFDGLRLDAVHTIADTSKKHIIDAIAAAVHEQFAHRHVHLILENERNEAQRLARKEGRPVLFTAQWNDDVHHVLHTAATGETAGYYREYCGDSSRVARALAEGFAYQGEFMAYRGSNRGEPSSHLPPLAFVAFLQNHDQIGNRAFGERLISLTSLDAFRAVAAIYLLSPQIPMLFMGEEWGSHQPFPFFCGFRGQLAESVRDGRRMEFARFPEFADPDLRARIPDPTNPDTFLSAKLRWEDIDQAAPRTIIDWYKVVLTLRHREIIPRLHLIEHGGEYSVLPSKAIKVTWRVGGECLTLVANLSPRPADCNESEAGAAADTIWLEGEWSEGVLSPWTVHWSLSKR